MAPANTFYGTLLPILWIVEKVILTLENTFAHSGWVLPQKKSQLMKYSPLKNPRLGSTLTLVYYCKELLVKSPSIGEGVFSWSSHGPSSFFLPCLSLS